jgi:hypothetical protein
MLENAMAVLSGLSRVEKAAFKCISTYKYLVKRTNTHGDTSHPSSWYIQQNPQMLENTTVIFSGLSRVEKAVFKCISTYIYLVKPPNTHLLLALLASWYL